jgi:hypothetical protein
MTFDETLKTLAIMKAAYPKFYIGMSKSDLDGIVSLWSSKFADEPYQLVQMAVNALLDTLQYPPTIADVKGKIRLLTTQDAMSEMEAWGMVRKAIANGNYHSEQEYERLPDALKKVVGSPVMLRQWAMLDISELETVVQSNFMRSYRQVAERQKQIDMLPGEAKAMIEGLADKVKMIGG